MTKFAPPNELRVKIERRIRISKMSKATSRGGIYNELLQVKPNLIAELLFEWQSLMGGSQNYPKSLSKGLLTPVLKKTKQKKQLTIDIYACSHTLGRSLKGHSGTCY